MTPSLRQRFGSFVRPQPRFLRPPTSHPGPLGSRPISGPRRPIALALLLLAAFPGRGDQVACVFEAVDRQRLAVHGISTGAGWVSRLDLVVKRPDNQEQILLTTQIPTCQLGMMILHGEALLTNMVEGTYRCFIRQIAHPGCNGEGATTNDHPIVYETSPGKRLNGLLNQDEVVENVDGLIVGEVVVPAGLKLTVRKTRVQSGGPVNVNGELAIEECTGNLRLGLSSSTGAGRVHIDRSELAVLAVGGLREAEFERCTVAGDVHVTGEHLRASFTDCTVTQTLRAEELVSVTWKRGRLPGWCFFRGVGQASFAGCGLWLQAIERGELTLTDCTLLALECADLDAASLERCHLAGGCKLGTGLTTGGVKRIQVTDCVWTGLDKSLQPLETCRVERSDFYGGGVEVIAARATCTLENNVFATTLRVRCPTAQPVFPTIRANSFLGPVSVFLVDGQGKDLGTPAGFSLAGNYWGSARGPAGATPDRRSGWLDGWGAGCSYPSAADYTTTGRTTASSLPQSIRPLPPVWVRGARMGQNVLGYVTGRLAPMRQGRDLLACYDLKTTAESLSGIRFWLVCGGDEARPVAPLDPAFEVRRDYGRPIAAPVAGNERRTLNFIVPADRTRTNTLSLQLWMDNSSLAGYREAGGVQRLGETTHLGLDAPPARPLVLGVVGTEVSVGGYKPALDPGADQRVANHLQETIPALWPLTTNDFQIVRGLGHYLYEGENTVGWLFSRTASVGLQTYLAWGLSRFLEEYNASAPQKLDFLVAVVPARSLSGAYGVTTARWHRICLVDERHPWAALHELGHCLGLYMHTEQYDLPDGPDGRGNLIDNQPGADIGARLQDLTAFVPEAGARFTQLGGRRIGHFPFGVDPSMHDLMGNNPEHWIVPTTLADIQAALRGLLGVRTGMAQAGGPPPARGGRLLFSGLLQHGPIPQYKVDGYRLVPESLSCRATTDQIKSPIHNTYTDYLGAFVAYDDWGGTVSIQSIRHAIPQSFRPEIAFWTQTFDLPGDAIRYELRNTFTGELLFSQSLSEASLQTSLQGPASGTVLPEAVALQWSATANGLPDSSLRSQLYFSADGLQNWIPLGSELRAPDVAVSSRGLPSASQLAFKLVTSDGFRVVTRQLSGLTVGNRAPSVVIRAPAPEATGPNAPVWTLDAQAVDPEDGLVMTGRWTSSRDGLLVTQAVIDGVHLSLGEHTLTFATQDSEGHPAQAVVTVTVGPDPAADLGLERTDLAVSVSGADPALETSGHLQRGRVNVLTLYAQNQGFANRIRLRLFVTPPAGSERLLGEQTLDAAPFARPWATFNYEPAAQGAHRFRGQIESLDQVDPHPANNTREWTYDNLPPVAFGGRWVVYTATPVVLPLRATDPDGDALSWALTEPPAHGQLTQTEDGWTYTSANYAGPDRFRFKVNDGLHDSPAVTVALEVLRPPAYLSYPTITSYLSPAAIVGLPFEYQITADRAPTSFEASGLPGPLVLDTRTGIISGRPAAAGTYSIKLTARNAAGSGSAYLRLLVRTNSPANVYAAWAGNWGLTAGQVPKNADFDGDGTANLIEFALGLSPTDPDRIADAVVPAFAVNTFTVTYRQRAGGQGEVGQNYSADGLLYRVEYTADLAAGAWSSGANVVQLVPGHRIPIGVDMEEVTVQLNPSLVAGAHGFLRLVIVDGP